MEATMQRGMTRNERRVVGYTAMAHALNHGVELVYGAVLLVVALEFGASLALLGMLATASALAYAASALPAGAVADRAGSKRMLVLSLGGSAVAAALAAASPNVTVLGVALVLMGLLGGIYHPAGLALITREVRERARGLGFHGMGGNLGTAVAPFVAAVIAGAWSWRASFVVFAALAALVALVLQFSRVTEENPTRQAPTAALGHPGRRPMPARTWVAPLILVFTINAFFGFIYRGTVTFLPLHLSRNLDFHVLGFAPVVIGGTFATLALLFGMVGQYIGGELGERVRREVMVIFAGALTVPALLLVGSTHGVILLAAAAAFAFFNFLAQPSYSALIADYATARVQGRVFGFTFLAGFGFGSFAGTLGGVIAERFGTSWVFIMLAGFGFLIALVGGALYGYVRFRGESRERG